MNRQFLSGLLLSRGTMTFAAAMALWCTSSVNADVWNVPGDAPTIQVAINLSSAGDEIEVEPNTYFDKIDLLGKTLVIRSTGGSAVTIIDAIGQFDPVIKITSGEGPETRIEGFTIRNGEATDAAPNERGGGVYCNLTSPTFVDCVFVDNEAVIGGAFYSNGGVIDFIDCEFDQNHASSVGGAAYQNGGTVNYTDCVFSGNTADSHAGAIRHSSAAGTYTRCLFDGNDSGANGGALDMAGGASNMTYRDCEFVDNTAEGVGGAVQLATPTASTITWINCIFRKNEALFGNGGAVNVIGRGLFLNCTFYGNLTNGGLGGGGIYVQPAGTAIARSCIAWGNSFGNFSGVTATYCTVENGYAGTGNSSSDPQFVNAAGGDLRLQESSPCIDAGDATQLPLTVATDFDLLPRVVNAASTEGISGVSALGYFVDMGAFEFQPAGGGPDPCPADTNGDGLINVTDLLNLLAAWGSCF